MVYLIIDISTLKSILGSIISTFDLSGKNDTLALAVDVLYDYMHKGCKTSYHESTLTCEKELRINGDIYTPGQVRDL